MKVLRAVATITAFGLCLCGGAAAIGGICLQSRVRCGIPDPITSPTTTVAGGNPGCGRTVHALDGLIPALPSTYTVVVNPCLPIAGLAARVTQLLAARHGNANRFINAVNSFAQGIATVAAASQCAYESDLIGIAFYYPDNSPSSVSVVIGFNGSYSAFEDTSTCFLRSLIAFSPSLQPTYLVAQAIGPPGGCLNESHRRRSGTTYTIMWLATDDLCPIMTGLLRGSTAVTIDADVRLRTGPALSSTVITTIPEGITIGTICSEDNGWIKASYLGQKGYVSGPLTSTGGKGLPRCVHRGNLPTASVVSDGLHLRKGPSTRFGATATVAAGIEVLVMCYVDGDSVTGWAGTSSRWDRVILSETVTGYMADTWLDTTAVNNVPCPTFSDQSGPTPPSSARVPRAGAILSPCDPSCYAGWPATPAFRPHRWIS
ncbi:MAG TPA: SH3 domain-containing protein [Candidatus Limnocylindrales bacterium]|nr:SH3 domain-containing protein [Candidatus Limnocylindrales bacterium]